MLADIAYDANDYFNHFNTEDDGDFNGHVAEEDIADTNAHYQTAENGQTSTNSADAATSSFGKITCNIFSRLKGYCGSVKEGFWKRITPESGTKAPQVKYDIKERTHALEYFEIDNCASTSNGKIGQKMNSEENNSDEFRTHFNRHSLYKSISMKTLGDSIKHFRLSKLLQQLEASLEDVRRNKKEKEMHEELFKQIDKEIQKLSFKYHPDKVKNRGGTEAAIEKAQKEQTALNSIRAALKILNSEFLEDIATDHKFEYYIGLPIDTICNENAMQNRIFEVILRTGILSRIKQQDIILEIREFLKESKNCIQSYFLDETTEFKTHRNSALFHLKLCIEGFEKLCKELDKIEEECKSEKNNKSMFLVMQKMAADCKRNARILKYLQDTAEAARKGKYEFFNPMEDVDSYFVLPFVCYVNVIMMCNVMVRTSGFFDKVLNYTTNKLGPIDDHLKDLVKPYYLTSYCSGNDCHKLKVLEILGKNDIKKKLNINENVVVPINQMEVKSTFREYIKPFVEKMKNDFKVEYYTVTTATDLLVQELKKCMTLMSEFEEKERKLSKKFQEYQEKTEKLQEKYAEIDKIMKAAEEMGQEVNDTLEKSRKFRESHKDIF